MKFGLIGEKLSHSYSPLIHRLFFNITGIKGEYKLFEIERKNIGEFLQNARMDKFAGLNVTIPYKTDVIPFLDELSPEAEKINAVNTISFNDRVRGYNTDYFGLDCTFNKHRVSVNGRKVLVMGSGGAAKAVVSYLLDKKAKEIYIASRDNAKAGEKFPEVMAISYSDIIEYCPFDIIINTTPVGMHPNTGVSPLTKEQVSGAVFLFDLIYNPSVTKLIEIADSLKISNTNGLYMLVAQAVKAQEIWHAGDYGIEIIDRIISEINKI
ncbi:MAG TPA: shikimate dehydrogenase [Ruminiclostridium sp.]|jgi:shikimate dehydrogenase|nr:shikimate dehydrogenase [Clostridiaceae bacterium]HAA25086.1 shikimate dehydrogenase [Ruminiclostridium sp.]